MAVITELPDHRFSGRWFNLPRELYKHALLEHVRSLGYQMVHHDGVNYAFDPLTKRVVLGSKGSRVYTELTKKQLSALVHVFPTETGMTNRRKEYAISDVEFRATFNIVDIDAAEKERLLIDTAIRKAAIADKEQMQLARFDKAVAEMQPLAVENKSDDYPNPGIIAIAQHEFGVSNQSEIGTDFLKQCHALVIYNPRTKATAFAHVDYVTDVRSIASMLHCVNDGGALTVHILASEYVEKSKIGETLLQLDKLSQDMNVPLAYGTISLDSSQYVFNPQTATIMRAKVPPIRDDERSWTQGPNEDPRFQSPLVPHGIAGRFVKDFDGLLVKNSAIARDAFHAYIAKNQQSIQAAFANKAIAAPDRPPGTEAAGAPMSASDMSWVYHSHL